MAAEYKVSPQTSVLTRGYKPHLSEGAVVPPVFRTSTFAFKNCQAGKEAFEIAYGLRQARDGEVPALIYTRVNNPNVEMVEDRVVLWDNAEAAAVFSSGMGAISGTCLSFLRPGDDAVFTDPIYGGSEYFFRHLLPAFGITTRPIAAGCSEADLDTMVAASQGKTKIIYVETPANPTMVLTDVTMVARVAKKHSTADRKVLTIVDNTMMGPVFLHPHALGADIVVYSATKFIGGHSDVVAGVATGPKSLIGPIKGTRTILGSNPDPDAAWLLLRSMGTLQLRMNAQAESAAKVVTALEAHPAIEKVVYPGRPIMGENQLKLYKEQCSGSGSLISFFVKGGEAEAFKVLDNLKHVTLAVSLGGIESLASHPSSMTHSDMTPAEKTCAGITENLVRLSVGLEDSKDLIKDLYDALNLIVHI